MGCNAGFCTPGILMTALELLRSTASPTDQDIREAISGNLCRCTGYQNIVRAIASAAAKLRAGELEPLLAERMSAGRTSVKPAGAGRRGRSPRLR